MAGILNHAGRLAAVAAAVAFASAGCAQSAQTSSQPPPRSPQGMVMIGDSASGKTVSVFVTGRVRLVLSSTYWTVTGSSAPNVLRQDGGTRLLARPSDCPKIPGLGCTPEETDFTALGHGKAVITAHRTSCGEALRCAPGKESFSVTIIVKNQFT